LQSWRHRPICLRDTRRSHGGICGRSLAAPGDRHRPARTRQGQRREVFGARLECTPSGGQVRGPRIRLSPPGFRGERPMAKHRIYSVEFKRQVVQDYLSGETLHGLAKRHDISRNLIRIWIAKHEAGALDSDTAAAKVLTEYEARIAALERLVGKLAL